MEINTITGVILHESIKIHRELGPGLLESIYEAVLRDRLKMRGLEVACQQPIPIVLDGKNYGEGYRLDLLVEHKVIVEVKSVQELAPIHFKQIQTYLRLMRLQVGLLINFNEVTLKEGYNRIANKYLEVS